MKADLIQSSIFLPDGSGPFNAWIVKASNVTAVFTGETAVQSAIVYAREKYSDLNFVMETEPGHFASLSVGVA